MSAARKMILCIEDDHEVATLIAEELIERGFAVSIAHGGHEGLAAAQRQTPDLVLCDISMPAISGFDLFKHVEEAPGSCDTPFVFLTALTDRGNELKARRLGADDFVTKPVDFDVRACIIDRRLAQPLTPTKPVNLNEREIAALTWAARGKTSVLIEEVLGLTKRTVDFHIDNARRRKLGAKTRIHAAIRARDSRLIEP